MLRFLLLGDWGKSGSSTKQQENSRFQHEADKNNNTDTKKSSSHQLQLASAIAEHANNTFPHPSFVLSLGDNFYNDGVSSPDDPLWDTLWRDVYIRNHTSLRIPWYPVLGNHDYGGGNEYALAQIQRTYEHMDDDHWQFFDSHYTVRHAIPNTPGHVQIVFVDTTTLAPSENKCCNEEGGVSKEQQATLISLQLSSLHRIFQSITRLKDTTWLLVAGHYPMYSAGSNGDTPELLEHLLPLLEKYQVDAYICGHDHISEHLQLQPRQMDFLRHNVSLKGMFKQESSRKIEFFVAGAGSMVDTVTNLPYTSEAKLIWYGDGYGAFAYMNATMDSLSIGYIDVYGKETYTYTMLKSSADVGHKSNVYMTSVVGMSVLSVVVLSVVCVWLLRHTYTSYTPYQSKSWQSSRLDTSDVSRPVQSDSQHPIEVLATVPATTHTHTNPGISTSSHALVNDDMPTLPSRYSLHVAYDYGNLTSSDEEDDGSDGFGTQGLVGSRGYQYGHRRAYTSAV